MLSADPRQYFVAEKQAGFLGVPGRHFEKSYYRAVARPLIAENFDGLHQSLGERDGKENECRKCATRGERESD